MRFKSQHKGSQMPELNLVPMMDVLMTILIFFIILSMTFTSGQKSVNVTLPSADAGTSQEKNPDPLVVGLNDKEEILLADNKAITKEELAEEMKTYLESNTKGAVILKADKNLPYEKVVRLLGEMRDIGGDSVSLAIEDK
ncbi:ExbD/TolR family protein [Limnofasciculus baicalensis]|uniref:Biopolymer transporter ExbD n=1 Tax=Limnofasciculus baicalensis BBK-W-15 TaxID=2699891 RepID=A0AAE3KNK9_9CYAN|nr:biopolymer transporter ExbD [Limnofasciculus baicalensis]MCP2729946.1 biopolymer transporter ExbD [Limnofasciculus baicalensis BBK-W-15]